MGLIGESGDSGNIGHARTSPEIAPGSFHTNLNQVGVWCDSELAFEVTQQEKLVNPHRPSHLVKRRIALDVRREEITCAVHHTTLMHRTNLSDVVPEPTTFGTERRLIATSRRKSATRFSRRIALKS
jgi:hypothetical protein